MAAQTGSTYISKPQIDSVEISTMTSSRKCSQMIATRPAKLFYLVLLNIILRRHLYAHRRASLNRRKLKRKEVKAMISGFTFVSYTGRDI